MITEVMTPVDKVLCIQHVDLFKHATTEMLAYIAAIARETEAAANEILFSEDDVSDAMYVIVSGRVRLEKAGEEILTVRERQSFGTWALLDNQPRLMTARAIGAVRLLKIRREDFYELLSDHDEITPVIFKAVIERVKRLVED